MREDTDCITDSIEITQMTGNKGPNQGIFNVDKWEKKHVLELFGNYSTQNLMTK